MTTRYTAKIEDLRSKGHQQLGTVNDEQVSEALATLPEADRTKAAVKYAELIDRMYNPFGNSNVSFATIAAIADALND